MKQLLFVAAVVAFVLVGCSGIPKEPSFAKDVHPVLLRHCSRCHNASESPLGITYDSYTAMMKAKVHKYTMPLVMPGKPDSSLAFFAITTEDVKKRMPPPGSQNRPMAKEEVELVKRWIEQGAKDN
jgi:uncharacterized membrane protein